MVIGDGLRRDKEESYYIILLSSIKSLSIRFYYDKKWNLDIRFSYSKGVE